MRTFKFTFSKNHLDLKKRLFCLKICKTFLLLQRIFNNKRSAILDQNPGLGIRLSVFRSELLVFCERKSKMRFARENEQIAHFALLPWATGANRSRSLFCKECKEQFSHGRFFVKSDRSNSFMVALLLRAPRENHSRGSLKKNDWAKSNRSD